MSRSGLTLKAPTTTSAPSVVSNAPVSGMAAQFSNLAVRGPLGGFLHLHGDHGVVERYRDLLAPAGLLAGQQCGQHTLDEVHSRRVVAQGGRIDGVRNARIGRLFHDAAHRLGEHILTALVGVGPLLAEARAGGANDARIDVPERLVAEAEPVHHPGAEIVDHHVGVAYQVVDHLLALLRLGVDFHRALIAVERGIDRVVEAFLGTLVEEMARQVAGARSFDLDHIGAEIG